MQFSIHCWDSSILIFFVRTTNFFGAGKDFKSIYTHKSVWESRPYTQKNKLESLNLHIIQDIGAPPNGSNYVRIQGSKVMKMNSKRSTNLCSKGLISSLWRVPPYMRRRSHINRSHCYLTFIKYKRTL